jgi:hypothetical protein
LTTAQLSDPWRAVRTAGAVGSDAIADSKCLSRECVSVNVVHGYIRRYAAVIEFVVFRNKARVQDPAASRRSGPNLRSLHLDRLIAESESEVQSIPHCFR